jgi:serine/threonine protein kinase
MNNTNIQINDLTVLGCGYYGCAIQPYIKLDIHEQDKTDEKYLKYTLKKNNDIAKVFIYDNNSANATMKQYINELNLLKRVQNIDKNNVFTVPLKGACMGYVKQNVYDQRTLTKIYKSIKYDEIKDASHKLHQIILGNGGSQLNNLQVFQKYEKENMNMNFKKFIKIFDKFLEGMILMENSQVVHKDIKPPNVLFDGKKMNLIDFGFLTSFDDLYSFNRSNIHIMTYKYIFFPPEYFVCGVVYNEIFKYFHDFIKKTNEKSNIGKTFKVKTVINFETIAKRFAELKCKDSIFVIDILQNLKLKEKTKMDHYLKQLNLNKDNTNFLKIYKSFFFTQLDKFIDYIIKTIQKNPELNLKHVLDNKIFDIQLKEKFDTYSLAFIILPFYKYLSREDRGKDKLNVDQELLFSYIFNSCSNANPHERITLKSLKELIEIQKSGNSVKLSSSNSSLSQSRNSLLPYISSLSQSSDLSQSSFSSQKGGETIGNYIMKHIDIDYDIICNNIIDNSLGSYPKSHSCQL